MRIVVINGPSIDLLGIREPEIYGQESYKSLLKKIKGYSKSIGIKTKCYQSNCEGKILNLIEKCYFHKVDGIVLNAGAYTHTSIALHDMLKATKLPIVEVHISDINNREDYRKTNYIKDCCIKSISGHGLNGYLEAIDFLVKRAGGKNA